MNMTPQEMIDVIQAHADGKRIEMRRAGEEVLGWNEITTPVWNFAVWKYRVKPAALRPHWPAVLTVGVNHHIVTDSLYPSLEDAKADCASDVTAVRLATEYPPVMLP